jgi:hypothetical protein
LYCDIGIQLDRCYTAELNRVESQFHSSDAIRIYGSNLITLRKVRTGVSNRGIFMDRQVLGTGETAKTVLFDSCNFEYNLYDGLYAQNVRQITLESCYFERNSQISDDPAFATRTSFMTFDATNDALKGSLVIRNSLFNSTSTTLDDIDLLYIKKSQFCELYANRFNFANTTTTKTNSYIRLEDAGEIYVNSMNMPQGNYIVPIYMEAGAKAILTSDGYDNNLIANGRLTQWQQATSQINNGINSCDRADFYRNGGTSMSITQQAFTDNQTDVQGYPSYYINHAIVGTPTSFGVSFLCGQIRQIPQSTFISAGVWVEASVASTVVLRMRKEYPGVGNVDSQSFTHNVTTGWTYISSVFRFETNAPNPIPADSALRFDVEFGSGLADENYSLAQPGVWFGSTPLTNLLSDTEELNKCLEYLWLSPVSLQWSGDVTSGTTYKFRVQWPKPMAQVPTVIFLNTSDTNFDTTTLAATEVDIYGVTVTCAANGTGYGELTTSIRAKTAI